MTPDPANFEEILAECLRQAEVEGATAVERACAAHPAHADALRRHVARLTELGLFDSGSGAPLPRAIGRYEILARLGRGGMGVVYLARDPTDGRRVALKTGPAALERGERSAARFEREVRAFANLRHENLVRVFDVGADGDRPFYVMEYVRGATLAEVLDELRADRGSAPNPDGARSTASRDVDRLRDVVRARANRVHAGTGEAPTDPEGDFGRTWIEFACRAVVEVARALGHVHDNGIVHRDVKPANVMIRVDGRAVLFDLGLAHVEDELDITATGDFAGTPHYVSPEVARGDVRAADARSDVFSLGVTLYELLTLRRPFEGENAQRILSAIAEREPLPLRRVDPALPRDLETICQLALEKDPRRRYANMDELADDLERFLAFRPVRARPIGVVRRVTRFARRRPAAAVAIALGALVAVGLPVGLFVANRAISSERDRAEAAAIEARDQARTSARVSEFLVDLLHLPEGFDDHGVVAEMLERGARRSESGFDDQPLVRAALFEALGRVHANEGAPERALPLFDRSLSLRQATVGERHADTARVLLALGELHSSAGRTAEARATLQRALASLRGATFRPIEDEARILHRLGEAHVAARELEPAIACLGEAADTMRRGEAGTTATLTHVLETLAVARRDAGDFVGARRDLEESLAVSRAAFVPDLPARARGLTLLADLLESSFASDSASRDTAARLRSEAGLLGPNASGRARESRTTPRPAWSSADGRALLASFAPPWRAEWERNFQAGITALQTERGPEAEAAFRRCLELRPFDPISAYNLACVHAARGDVDGGIEWLRRAVEMDAGYSPLLVEVVATDPDTAVLRAEPRAAEILARLRTPPAPDEFRVRPFVPTDDGRSGARPVFVVLADAPARAEPEPAWCARARAFGAIVLQPTPPRRTSTDADAKRVWVDSMADFARRPWHYAEPVVDALRVVCVEHEVEREGIVLVGVGSGALVAFDLAVRAPGLFRGVLTVDGPIHASLSVESAYAAVTTGSNARAIVSRGAVAAPVEAAASTSTFLDHCGFGAGRARYEAEPDTAGAEERLRATLGELLSALRR